MELMRVVFQADNLQRDGGENQSPRGETKNGEYEDILNICFSDK